MSLYAASVDHHQVVMAISWAPVRRRIFRKILAHQYLPLKFALERKPALSLARSANPGADPLAAECVETATGFSFLAEHRDRNH